MAGFGVSSAVDELGVEARGGRTPRLRLCKYYLMCLLVTGSLSTIGACVCSSSMGVGLEALNALEELSYLSKWGFAMCLVITLVLYTLDFFWPPHRPGHFLSLWEGDTFCGRLILCIAGCFLGLAVLLWTRNFPIIPVVLTTTFCPLCLGLVHHQMHSEPVPKGRQMSEIPGQGDEQGHMASKMSVLKRILGRENDTLAFFKAATTALMTTSIILFVLWLIIVSDSKKGLDELEEDAPWREKDKIWILWATPLLIAISFFVMGLFSLLRVFLQRSYSATNIYRNRLIAETLQSSLHDDLMAYQLSRVSVISRDTQDAASMREQYLTQHAQHIKQLSMLVKVVACIFVLVIGTLYVVSQLLYTSNGIALMVTVLVGSLFLVYALFIWVAFNRIVKAMGSWIQDLPVWKVFKSVMVWPITRATFICLTLPVIPLVLALSWLNQRVRIWRHLYKASYLEDPTRDPASFGLTPRIRTMAMVVCRSQWLAIVRWCYILCGIHVCFTICPMLLNVSLAWLRSIAANWNFGVIVVATFMIGVGVFLLPPVPGMTVYIFGGLVISGTCPPVRTARGFWLGSVVNILMCWFLKMVACAVQQVCIGRMLGRSLWVRRTVRVHKVAIRCIEAELRTPGFSVGKVAILCGGPDWPTSVLAGVLNLSLWQCELGTLPIIGFVLPCALSGSLYLKKHEGDIWARSANMMVVASVVINLILWAIAFWATQNRLEANYEELNTRLPEHADLHWLDYLEEQLAKRSAVTWHELPMLVRALYVTGAFTQIVVCHGLNWGHSYLFGSFQVQDEIETLVLWPSPDSNRALFTRLSIAVLCVYLLAFAGALQFYLWRRLRTSGPKRQALKELDLQEAQWKEAFLLELEQEEAQRRRSKTLKVSSSNSDTIMLENLIGEINSEHENVVKVGLCLPECLPEVEMPVAPPPPTMVLPEPEVIPTAVACTRAPTPSVN